MRRVQRIALLNDLVSRLREAGSWGGEMHVQKCAYLLQELFEVPLEFKYVLYKYGPYSFELHEELASMRADDLIRLEPQPFPYGPKIEVTDAGRELADRFRRTRSQFAHEMDFIVRGVGMKTAAELEEVSTAFMVIEDGPADDSVLVRRLTQLKPRLSRDRAERRIREARQLKQEAQRRSRERVAH